jgi:hypothetical protein
MMAEPLNKLELARLGIRRGNEIAETQGAFEPWSLSAVTGRLSLLCGVGRVSAAAALVVAAQAQKEPCAWVVEAGFEPFAPDLAAAGIALESLVLVRATRKLARAADLLARTGGLGLVVIDADTVPPRAMLRRLAEHAQRHAMAVVLLADRASADPAISLLVRLQLGSSGCLCFDALRDRRHPSLWHYSKEFDALPGSP